MLVTDGKQPPGKIDWRMKSSWRFARSKLSSAMMIA
jgi:hypothetical protein